MLLFPWTWGRPLVGSCQAQKTLQDLTSSYGAKQIKNEAQLTSREVEICDMIKNGISGKEIAEILNISHGTIERHRNNIRMKLGIKNSKINLSSFLKTL
jgi:DNA-binding NarL/FixJ family response regulator